MSWDNTVDEFFNIDVGGRGWEEGKDCVTGRRGWSLNFTGVFSIGGKTGWLIVSRDAKWKKPLLFELEFENGVIVTSYI